MKIRQGFVSNSSSSSFVVIGSNNIDADVTNYVDYSDTLTLGNRGVTEFGWDTIRYSSMFDRINFAYLQVMYMTQKPDIQAKWKAMLDVVIKAHFKCREISWGLTDDYDAADADSNINYGYIDHQSCSAENSNIEIFDDIYTLERFLFCDDSYIQGGNDNG